MPCRTSKIAAHQLTLTYKSLKKKSFLTIPWKYEVAWNLVLRGLKNIISRSFQAATQSSTSSGSSEARREAARAFHSCSSLSHLICSLFLRLPAIQPLPAAVFKLKQWLDLKELAYNNADVYAAKVSPADFSTSNHC